MRLEVFKIKDDNWGVRLTKELEIAGFQSVPAAHDWILQYLLGMISEKLSKDALKKTLKAGQDELDRILNKAAKNDDDQPI